MKEIALIGPTACGKSALAIEMAKECNAFILSLDSLGIYKEIDIASAKPSKKEREEIRHFGIDVLYPNEYFNVAMFFDLYKNAKKEALTKGKNLIITGGSGFYLKAMIEGLSTTLKPKKETLDKIAKIMTDLKKAFDFIKGYDPSYAQKISDKDRYRIQKWYEIFLETDEVPSLYLKRNRQKPVIENIKIFNIKTERELLKERIKKRTALMIKEGIVDEVFYLEQKYKRDINPMKAIGIKESLEYLDGFCSLKELENKIAQNTAKLAKRQRTFNKTQFKNIQNLTKEKIKKEIYAYFKNCCLSP